MAHIYETLIQTGNPTSEGYDFDEEWTKDVENSEKHWTSFVKEYPKLKQHLKEYHQKGLEILSPIANLVQQGEERKKISTNSDKNETKQNKIKKKRNAPPK
ncbi:hypothetical protein RFI_16327 [Reticulomyxa filosa]|uniref:Uncharacterized protein n=1 Tax=Reticulomyxa filosa TaxID=46433 RepID=X6N6H9_RETFI|nr:hypothetical protein RFI_16327 [Reticulomyxa filosa]|eukprot:ETO20882.1 hypothetical protein RFI_16327 [Reticulomyxa filosa]